MNTARQKYASSVYEKVKNYKQNNTQEDCDKYGGMALKLILCWQRKPPKRFFHPINMD